MRVQKPVKIIAGTDWWTDCDDAVALRLLARAHLRGEIELLGVAVNACMEDSAPSLDAYLSIEGLPNLPLDGLRLVREKVNKLWAMAGNWADPRHGFEHNFAKTPRASSAANIVCKKWPTPVTFLGFEVGQSVITGGRLPEGDPLRQILIDHGTPAGRCSWDPMLALLVLTGDEKAAGYGVVRGRASVSAQSGINRFKADENGPHAYVVKERPDAFYRQNIDLAIGP